MRRRLDLAGALVAAPPVLFLDEPTTGLDPHSRNELWDVIRDLVAQGSTLLLTTQYMEEADQLADDIVVIDRGHQIAHGTADQRKKQLGGERMEVCIDANASMADARRILAETSPPASSTSSSVASPCRSKAAPGPSPTPCAHSTAMVSGCTTLACASPPWTTCSSP